ncbi:MAG TPA: CYTH and CHAD domain-containing protein, partial [Kineosporiaceae bacterium]|nr:CYTH and CHAD domain-containing protein [Kineosporiaceae bacterium]
HDQPPAADGPVVVAEIERKFEVDEGFVLPDVSDLPGIGGVAEPRKQHLDATYFDTADLRLEANKLTLRRRTGGDDAGWHLKRPRTGGDRDEIREPLGRATKNVPPSLQALVAVHARGAAIEPVVRLVNDRIVHRVLDEQGAVLAELAEDDVTASRPGPGGKDGKHGVTTAWRELEVELVGGDLDLLAALVDRVRQAGAVPSNSPSKLSRALGVLATGPRASRPTAPAEIKPKSAGGVLLAHLIEQIAKLKAQDPLVRADEQDAVHQMRVACRRLRSALATYRPLVDREITEPIRAELQWLGGVLGAARDTEVTRDHLTALVAAEPPDLVLGPVAARIVTALGTRYRKAHDAALVELDGRRYFDLLDSLDRLITAPPFTEQAGRRADDVVLPLVARTWKRTRRLVNAAHAESDPARHDPLLHEVRKAAKRARYAAESLIPTHGKPAKRWAARMEAIQEVLGDHQDSVVIRQELRALAVAAHLDGENGFSYGRLHALEQNRANDTERRFEQVWAEALDPAQRRWLS